MLPWSNVGFVNALWNYKKSSRDLKERENSNLFKQKKKEKLYGIKQRDYPWILDISAGNIIPVGVLRRLPSAPPHLGSSQPCRYQYSSAVVYSGDGARAGAAS